MMNPNGKSGSDDIYTTLPETSETTGPSKTNLTCTQTYYYFGGTQSSSYFDDSNFYNMIFGTGTGKIVTVCDVSNEQFAGNLISS